LSNKSFVIKLIVLAIALSIAIYLWYVMISGPVYHGTIVSNVDNQATIQTNYGTFVVNGASSCYVVGMHVIITSFPPIRPSWGFLEPTIMGSC